MINSKQLSRQMHAHRSYLPAGSSWKDVEQQVFKWIVDTKVIHKLSNIHKRLSIHDVQPALRLEKGIVALALQSLIRKGRLRNHAFGSLYDLEPMNSKTTQRLK